MYMQRYRVLTLLTRPLVSPCKDRFCFIKFIKFQGIFHELPNQNRLVCTYSECMIHGDSKKVMNFNSFEHFMMSAHAFCCVGGK